MSFRRAVGLVWGCEGGGSDVVSRGALWMVPEQGGRVVLGVLAKTSRMNELDVEIDVGWCRGRDGRGGGRTEEGWRLGGKCEADVMT